MATVELIKLLEKQLAAGELTQEEFKRKCEAIKQLWSDEELSKTATIKQLTEIQKQLAITLKMLEKINPIAAASTKSYQAIQKMHNEFNEIIRDINGWRVK